MVDKDDKFSYLPWWRSDPRRWVSIDTESYFKSLWIGPIIVVWAIGDERSIDHLSIGYCTDYENTKFEIKIVDYFKG